MAVQLVRRDAMEAGEAPDDRATFTTPYLSPDLPARRVVASWNVLRVAHGPAVRAALQVRAGGETSPWMPIGGRGPGLGDERVERLAPGFSLDADEVVAEGAPVEAARLRLSLDPGLAPPARAALAFWPVFEALELPARPVPARLTEGRIAQHALHPERGRHLCGPSSLTMALRHFGRSVEALEIADRVRCPWSGLHGNWTQMAALAGEEGLVSFVERGGGPARLAEHLAKGRLAILSLRWVEGELPEGAVPRSPGHLVLAVGVDREGAWVMDPAFRDPAVQVVHYSWQSVVRCWKSGAMVVVGER